MWIFVLVCILQLIYNNEYIYILQNAFSFAPINYHIISVNVCIWRLKLYIYVGNSFRLGVEPQFLLYNYEESQ